MKLADLIKLDTKTDRILVTCALPYVNNVPHLGNLVPILSADVYSRYLKLKGLRYIYICATDEHGTRTEIEAAKQGIDENTYCQRLHDEILSIFKWFNIDFTHFGRTSAEENHKLTQDIFKHADKNGYVVEKEVRQLYCEKDKMFLPDTYVEGICPKCNAEGAKGDQCDTCGSLLDPLELNDPHCVLCKAKPSEKTSKYLFLKLEKLALKLKDWIESKDYWDGIIRNMPLGWIEKGLNPRAITRDLKWGVKVPKKSYEDQVFYVWFDAPIGYIGATWEWTKKNKENLDAWWKRGKARLIHFLGKDNVPFHTIMWPATLMAADDDWNLPDYVASNEYLNYEGGAFSKSRNRGVFSNDVLQMEFPPDVWRYYIIANRPEKSDSDFSFKSLQTMTNADLVGNIGNLVNRLFSFTQKHFGKIPKSHELNDLDKKTISSMEEKGKEIEKYFKTFEMRNVVRHILELGDIGNKYLQVSEPWKTMKTDKLRCETSLNTAFKLVHLLLHHAWPIIPETCETVLGWIDSKLNDKFKEGKPVRCPGVLFKKIEDDTVNELIESYKGEGESLGPLEFVKEKGIKWPCVILEFKDVTIKRKISKLENLKHEVLKKINLDKVENSKHVDAYDSILKKGDLGGRVTSVRNLIKIVKEQGKIPNINAVADIYNLYSLKHGLVMGAYDKKTIKGKLIYAIANGSEHFIPIKGKAKEKIHKGEWVLKDESDMVVTKATTKQSLSVAVTIDTKGFAMCIQGNDEISVKDLKKISEEMAKEIVSFCEGTFRVVHVG